MEPLKSREIVDFHTHIFPKRIREKRRLFFSETPFKLLYDSPESKLVGAREMIEAMDAACVDRAVVFGFPWRNPETVKRNNDYVLEAVGRHPDRLIGFCCLDPRMKSGEKEVERCLDSGLGGVGELAFYESGVDEMVRDQLAPIMEICRDRNVPVLIHTNEPVGHRYPGKTPIQLDQIYGIVRRFSNNRIVLAHWGGRPFFLYFVKKGSKGNPPKCVGGYSGFAFSLFSRNLSNCH